MLYTLAVILLIAWLLGIVGTYTIGAFVHVLLVIAIVLFIVGHVVIGTLMSTDAEGVWPLWIHMIIWPLMTLILSLALLQPVKGAVVGLQWALRMHGFGGDET